MDHPALFSDPALALPAALRQALAARGYDTAMPVQTAILDAAARGRDLLVSSPTGSGKTIAFGAALAETLLAGAAATAPKAGSQPRALVIVPTRELAAQVREELGWLLADTGWRLAALTGGTAISGDLRALRRGVDVAIGTPGRLCDLLRRQALALGGLAVVVLDEADEMLDLGFREDLEILLAAAPAERRTLMFSATLPAPMRALARRFQRDALAIDPRRVAKPGAPSASGDAPASGSTFGAGPPAPHEDITYVAHLIAGDDRLAAVINVLRGSGAGRAIVFCTTRESVGALHRELLARGFSATAISGERAQAERDRALDQVRQGEARILVATNVAARGLHLPDVDLIVHADLPLNAESLTHRSGRTGRAGRKGTAVVIANLAERRKAERLLSAARVRVEWTAPPSAKAIAGAARAQLCDSLVEAAAAAAEAAADPDAPGVDAGDVDALLTQMQARLPLEELARRLLARELARLPTGERLLPVPLPGAGGAARGGFGAGDGPPPRRRAPGDIARDGVRFRVNIGAQDQADPRWLLPLICRRGGVTRREVGAIRIGPEETVFEIAGDAAADFALSASQRDPRAPHVRVERVERVDAGSTGGPPGGAPEPHRPPSVARARPPEARATYASNGFAKSAARTSEGRAAHASNGFAKSAAKTSEVRVAPAVPANGFMKPVPPLPSETRAAPPARANGFATPVARAQRARPDGAPPQRPRTDGGHGHPQRARPNGANGHAAAHAHAPPHPHHTRSPAGGGPAARPRPRPRPSGPGKPRK